MPSTYSFVDGHRDVSFRYDILDKDNNKIGEANNITSGKVSFNSSSSVHRTANFTIKEEGHQDPYIGILKGNTYTSYDFPYKDWSKSADMTLNGGLLGAIREPDRTGLNSEMDGRISPTTNTRENWSIFHDKDWTTFTTDPDVTGVVGNAMRVTRQTPGSYHRLGFMSEYAEDTFSNKKVYFSFNYKLTVSGNPSPVPTIWAIPSNSVIGDNWLGSQKVPPVNITTTGIGGDWYNCKAWFQVSDSSSFQSYRFAFGYDDSVGFSFFIDNCYIRTEVAVPFTNEYEAKFETLNISYDKVVNGIIPNLSDIKVFFDKIDSQRNASSGVMMPYNQFQVRGSTNSGTSWSAWTDVANGVSTNVIPSTSDARFLRLQLRWRFNRYSLKDIDTSVKNVRIEVVYNAFDKNPKTDQIDYRTQRIKPYLVYKEGTFTAERPLGIFLLNSPKRKDSPDGVYRDIVAEDQLSILRDAKVVYPFEIYPDYTYGWSKRIKDILTGQDAIVPVKFGYNFPASFVDIEQTSYGFWGQPMRFEAGVSWLTVLNTMLLAINYTPLYVTGAGVVTAKPYVPPKDRGVYHEYKDDNLSVIFKQAEEEFDISDVPNVFVLTQQANSEGERLYSRFFNTNIGSLSSTVNVGRYIVEYLEVSDVDDQNTLDELCSRRAHEASQAYGTVIFKTALMADHEYMQNIRLRYQPLGIEGEYTETDWTMDLRVGGQMEHRVRRVVEI